MRALSATALGGEHRWLARADRKSGECCDDAGEIGGIAGAVLDCCAVRQIGLGHGERGDRGVGWRDGVAERQGAGAGAAGVGCGSAVVQGERRGAGDGEAFVERDGEGEGVAGGKGPAALRGADAVDVAEGGRVAVGIRIDIVALGGLAGRTGDRDRDAGDHVDDVGQGCWGAQSVGIITGRKPWRSGPTQRAGRIDVEVVDDDIGGGAARISLETG